MSRLVVKLPLIGAFIAHRANLAINSHVSADLLIHPDDDENVQDMPYSKVFFDYALSIEAFVLTQTQHEIIGTRSKCIYPRWEPFFSPPTSRDQGRWPGCFSYFLTYNARGIGCITFLCLGYVGYSSFGGRSKVNHSGIWDNMRYRCNTRAKSLKHPARLMVVVLTQMLKWFIFKANSRVKENAIATVEFCKLWSRGRLCPNGDEN